MFEKDKNKGDDIFKFQLGDEVKDTITGFCGVIVARSQWLHNCNTYGVQPKKLKDDKPVERHFFDEPALEVVDTATVKPKRSTGGPEQRIMETNR